MTYETYRLTLEHFICDGEDRHRLDEPLVVQMIVDRQYAPTAICLNRMLDMMREELLRREGEGCMMTIAMNVPDTVMITTGTKKHKSM